MALAACSAAWSPGSGVEQLQVLLAAGGVAENLQIQSDAAGQAGLVGGGQIGWVVDEQAGHRPARPVGGERHAASPPAAVRRARRALAEASASCAKYALRNC
jgi:hypothetical protein